VRVVLGGKRWGRALGMKGISGGEKRCACGGADGGGGEVGEGGAGVSRWGRGLARQCYMVHFGCIFLGK
jgi:hypothetical protein